MSERPIGDQAQRDRIETDLDTNLLVEAGAGSGKTWSLLNRLVALIRTGTAEISHIAAVTFTRKAAAELREGFQTRLEAAIEEARSEGGPGADRDEIERLEAAVRDIDRGFIGTIHAFCARLLRERPLEARLDPSFREIFGPEEERLRRQAWDRHLERLIADGDESLATLRSVNLEPSSLYGPYAAVVEQPDVTFPADVQKAPEVGGLRAELEALLDEAVALLPDREPEPKWGSLQTKVRRLEWARRSERWYDDAFFFDALEGIVGPSLKPTYKRWGANCDAIRPVEAAMTRFADKEGPAADSLRRWRAYRYKIVLDFIQRAAETYAADRRRLGLVTFNDLLMDTVRLLTESPLARRDLARRYRHLLVDEFQDTDPIQAEIVFLLTATDPEETDWHKAVPRDGALFVVGDPKQSIYRFRRADIGTYNQVKARFERRDEVLSLTTNFRSQPPIEEFVNGVFEGFFPADATEHQAAFAPLNVCHDDQVPRGVYWYEVACASKGAPAVAAADAPLVASWIKARIDSGERVAGDFLVLTRRKNWLSDYGVELEKRGIPFQISGAGVDINEELQELVAVVRALNDPHNVVHTVAVLVGLFFGIDHEQLAAHRLDHDLAETLGRRMFDFTTPEFRDAEDSSTPVERALAQLCRWWNMTLALPADVVIGTIVDDLGLFPYLAAGEAGSSNAGALAYVLNAVRRAGVNGDTSLGAALEALDEALRDDEVEAPLQPGRDDVVRVMNLHKAKGLEANVVVLAHPAGRPDLAIKSVVQRVEGSRPRGAFVIQRPVGRFGYRIVAAPLDWDELAALEAPCEDAEEHRLLYVAATRARQELLISYCEASENSSPWQPFYAFRDSLCGQLDVRLEEPPERQPLELAEGTIQSEIDDLEKDRRQRAEPSYEITSVTKMVKHDTSIFAVDAGGLGRAWGNAVHEALEAANRGVGGDGIRAICRTALLDNDLPLDADGEPADLDDLEVLVGRVRGSDTWQRAREAETVLVEAPFALAIGGRDRTTIVEGVIDLAFAEPDGWVIVDYKTDVVDDPDNLEARRRQYRAQVDAYAEYFERISGQAVKERQILWVGMGLDAEVW
ncbi:MAG: UvrD-helicase domain-containing protein [Acidobacteria bacterium]|nr:UvrD-helicase domain-containing protein [Acidobacteriota bacterium]